MKHYSISARDSACLDNIEEPCGLQATWCFYSGEITLHLEVRITGEGGRHTVSIAMAHGPAWTYMENELDQ
jgi:hypothetical protein